MIEQLSTLQEHLLNGSSFHGQTICTTVKALRKAFGKETFRNKDTDGKVQYEWLLCHKNILTIPFVPFYVYDWKEYRRFKQTDLIEFHIGSNEKLPDVVIQEINDALYLAMHD